MKASTVSLLCAALACASASAQWSATQSASQTILGGGSENFDTGGWTSAGIVDVYTLLEVDFVQTRGPAFFGDFWSADADGEATISDDPNGAFFNAIGIEFGTNITELNLEVFSANGNVNPPFPGGVNVDLFDDGNFVGAAVIEMPRWTNNSNPEWVTIANMGAGSFDEIRIYTPFVPSSNAPVIDNLTWTIPSPASAALLGVAGLAASRRRRA